jgi:hypothetical protein
VVLLTHIIIAILSVGCSFYSVFSPTWKKIHITYLFTAGTLISGTLLVFQNSASLTRVCVSGLVFLAFMVGMIFAARRRLAHSTSI